MTLRHSHTTVLAFGLCCAATTLLWGQHDPEPSPIPPGGKPIITEHWFQDCINTVTCRTTDIIPCSTDDDCERCSLAFLNQECGGVNWFDCDEYQEGDLNDCGNFIAGICVAENCLNAMITAQCARTTCIPS